MHNKNIIQVFLSKLVRAYKTIENLLSLILIISSLLLIILINNLDILPNIYLISSIVLLVVIDLFFIFLIKRRNKVLKTCGYVLIIVFILIKLLLSFYIYKTNSFLDKSFTNNSSTIVSSESDFFNIYVGGLDFTNTNMDFNMIISINKKNHDVLLISIPRDYYIEVDGQNGKKDTLSYMGSYGIETSTKSLEKLFNIDINYYVQINTESLVELVDQVGGITYCSNESYTTTHSTIINSYDDTKGQKLYVKKGCQELNGIETLTVARERKNITGGDTGRQKNCAKIIEAIITKVKSVDTLTNYSNILNAVSNLYQTSIPRDIITDIIKSEFSNNWNIKTVNVDGTDSKDYVHLSNLIDWVMYPDVSTVNNVINIINQMKSGKTLEELNID